MLTASCTYFISANTFKLNFLSFWLTLTQNLFSDTVGSPKTRVSLFLLKSYTQKVKVNYVRTVCRLSHNQLNLPTQADSNYQVRKPIFGGIKRKPIINLFIVSIIIVAPFWLGQFIYEKWIDLYVSVLLKLDRFSPPKF